MIIFDTNNNFDGKIKGMLYLSLMDADYLVKKYGVEELKGMIPEDYALHLASEVERHKNERTYSPQYYAVIKLGIESEDDERILFLLSQEVEMGNLFTKSQLSSLSEEKVNTLVCELENKEEPDNIDVTYKLRSFMMARYILSSIDSFNRSVDKAYQGIGIIPNEMNIIQTNKNWENMGVSSDIKESAYFDKAVELAKRFN